MTGAILAAGLVATAAALVLPPAPGRRLRRLGLPAGEAALAGRVGRTGRIGRIGRIGREGGSLAKPTAPAKAPGPGVQASVDLALELIAVCMSAGQPLDAALASVGAALPDPVGPELRSMASALRLGLPAERSWGALGVGSAHLPEMGRVLARVADGGVPAARMLTGKAAAMRAASQARALAAARRVGVMAVFPLVVCLLPAFGLMCVVPAVLTALPGSGA